MRGFVSKEGCPQLAESVEIAYDTTRKRFIRAVKDIPIGEIVCLEKGVVVNIDPSYCKMCLAALSGEEKVKKVCELCESEYLKNYALYEEPTEGTIENFGLLKLALRILLSYDVEDIQNNLKEFDSNFKPILETSKYLSVMQLLQGDPIDISMFSDIIQKIEDHLLKVHPSWSKVDNNVFHKALNDLCNRLPLNAHTIYPLEKVLKGIDDELPSGSGIFPISSIFNHSCKPNVYSYFVKDTFVFVSMGVKQGEELLDNYGASLAYMSFNERKKFLPFDCICRSCVTLDQTAEDLVTSNDVISHISTYKEYEVARKQKLLPFGHVEWAKIQNSLLCHVLSKEQKIQVLEDELSNMRARDMFLHPDQTIICLRLVCVLGLYEFSRAEDYLICALIRINLFQPVHPSKKICEELLHSYVSKNPNFPEVFRRFRKNIESLSRGYVL